jgi:hypothetical protein
LFWPSIVSWEKIRGGEFESACEPLKNPEGSNNAPPPEDESNEEGNYG